MGLSVSSGPPAVALIVDEVHAEREEYAAYLTQHGIRTVQATDGLHGIAHAASQLPDVIAVDLGVPDRDIIDMCVRLKREESTRHIPIVGLSSVCKVDEFGRAMRAGCVSVLLKPCSPEELLEEIRRVISLR